MSIVIPAIATSTVTYAQIQTAIAAAPKYAWKTYQVVRDFNPPVINVPDTVFALTGGVRFVSAVVEQDNDDNTARAFDFHIILDGTTHTSVGGEIGALEDNTEYYIYMPCHDADGQNTYVVGMNAMAAELPMILSSFAGDPTTSKPLCGHAITFQTELKNGAGTNLNMYVKVTYELLELV